MIANLISKLVPIYKYFILFACLLQNKHEHVDSKDYEIQYNV